ncbi:hypothetical protein L1887_23226 [Cichorium endivia]|nr:hypothetical protein L1887_23226 [Cichorium endivia]
MSDEEFKAAFEESIIRESSPELESYNEKRDEVIKAFNDEISKSKKENHNQSENLEGINKEEDCPVGANSSSPIGLNSPIDNHINSSPKSTGPKRMDHVEKNYVGQKEIEKEKADVSTGGFKTDMENSEGKSKASQKG